MNDGSAVPALVSTTPDGRSMVLGTSAHRRRSNRLRSERAAALVEFAIVAPLLFALLLGMFTGGMAFNRKLALTNAVREGSRFGATLGVTASTGCGSATPGTLDCWLTQVADTVVQAAEGELGTSVSARVICVAYVDPAQTRRLRRTSSGDAFTNATCFNDGRASSESRVQVTATRDAQIEFIFATRNVTLATESVSRFEAID